MDLSELLPVVAALIVAMLGMIAFRSSSRIASKAVRLAMRILAGSLAAIPLLIATALIFFALNYTRHLPQQISPDGRLIAITTYTVNNGTGVDQAEISIRHPWNPYAHRVYAGPAEYKPNAKNSRSRGPVARFHPPSGSLQHLRFDRQLTRPHPAGLCHPGGGRNRGL